MARSSIMNTLHHPSVSQVSRVPVPTYVHVVDREYAQPGKETRVRDSLC